ISKPHAWEAGIYNKIISDKLRKQENTYRDKVRFYTFWFQIERLKKEQIKGAFAELGVYKGETASIIHQMDTSRTLHLFDTFQGFSKTDLDLEKSTDSRYRTSNFADTDITSVKEYIDGNDRIFFHAGYFPETTKGLKDESYAFVHIDADLYKPTIDALNYFYPKLSPGGVILIHDYNHNWEGVEKAIDAFALTIPEVFTGIADWQGTVLLVKNRR
ncbi:MAG: class I SAM-dependent methyltransferase, partial [Cytophagales bacterium]|nr:class I SAM-dependent methyltransferase [Cytophaga sp.]